MLAGRPLFVAHTPAVDDGPWHKFEDHAAAVAELCHAHCKASTGIDDIGRFLGYFHDVGKLTPEFQKYLDDAHNAKTHGTAGPRPGSAPHKQHVVTYLAEIFGDRPADFLSTILYGHHGGLPASPDAIQKSRGTVTGAAAQAVVSSLLTMFPDESDRPNLSAITTHSSAQCFFGYELLGRMLFSSLVDADAIDTAAHVEGHPYQPRLTCLPDLFQILLQDTARLNKSVASPLATKRQSIFDQCVVAGELAPGAFSLTVPTGGGKTRASLAFALAHAAAHNKTRVIYAAPFTTIIEQTASTFRAIFERLSNEVIEDHSRTSDVQGLDENAERAQTLSAENWDASIIVTTTVQLFESLFANKPKRCRKIHNLANSVIILDEVQSLPSHVLTPILQILSDLVNNFGVSVVLCTATQPSFETAGLLNLPVRNILPPDFVAELFQTMKRVSFTYRPDPIPFEELAAEIFAGPKQALSIVNTRRHAFELLQCLRKTVADDQLSFLSTDMCPQHRLEIMQRIKGALASGDPHYCVSTQVIEAGVDVDFPMVFRAMAPLDALIQAAGRCNREGRLDPDKASVVVFETTDGASPQGIYRAAIDRTRLLLRQFQDKNVNDIQLPQTLTSYSQSLLSDLSGHFDKYDIQKLRPKRNYPEVADRFQMIPDDYRTDVVVPFVDSEGGSAEPLIRLVKQQGRITGAVRRKLSAWCVGVDQRLLSSNNAPVIEAVDGLWVWTGTYDSLVGLSGYAVTDRVMPSDDLYV